MSFSEEHSGTNAVALAAKLNKPAYILPYQHYCDFLKELHFYASPIYLDGSLLCYTGVSAVNRPLSTELIAFTELFGYYMAGEIKSTSTLKSPPGGNPILLSKSQLAVLNLIVKGLPDKAIASELGIGYCTVKYHKSNIFKELNAGSSVEAAVKALLYNIVSAESIGL